MFEIQPARRTLDIHYAIRDIVVIANEVAKTGKKMLYLNIGDPNVYGHRTPQHIIEAIYKAMNDNQNGYAPSSGIKGAIDAIERDANRKGINDILDIFITTGASEAIEICLTALLNSGENFLMPTPGYPLYTAIQSKLELVPNPYYLDENNGWQPDVEDIKSKINDKTRAIVLINPNNPTGSVCQKETLLKIIDIALEHNLLIMSDEIYDKLLFDDNEHVSIASLNKDVSCVTFSGLSKNYVAPGFRLGWGIASGRKNVMYEYLEAVNRILRARLCANHPIQYAVIPALDGSQAHIAEMNKILQKRRDIVMNMLPQIPGITCVKPGGAFYMFPSIDVKDDKHFTIELIKQTGVVVVHGEGFGQKPGSHHFRIVILPPEEVLTQAFEMIGEFYEKYKKMN
ncbi:MAG: aminotransferase [Ignavibacteria bacterium GWB2_35_12]|nr:MAG: aminotransferase [Ignavibacteria bacterium GWA2_35_8]OGU38307.1 MAG: aminotransferase [Ignavibacteria bacterium GWB2_35_12]OGU89597.1 MAG: aminotransferase [Ignavibacteria bacterium RIFOXYA2_FULL_35_10]OGV20754.1 MAG: aminotransferase [Ignavibacteria bacterium RIFOXYC2_FULL_35_21]